MATINERQQAAAHARGVKTIKLQRSQLERLREIARERGTTPRDALKALVREAAQERNLPLVAAISDEDAWLLQSIADHDGGGVDAFLGQLLASREAQADGALSDPEEAIADAERSVEENADVPEDQKKSDAPSPLSPAASMKVWARIAQPNDGHPSRGGRR